MKRKNSLIFFLLLLSFTYLDAQAFECTIEQSVNPTLDSLYISFFIQKTSGEDFIMGYAIFKVHIERATVNISNVPKIVESNIWHDNSNYTQMIAGRNIPNSWVSLQISGITPNGYVTSARQLIGTIAIPILDQTSVSGVIWNSSEVYDEKSNLIIVGNFANPPPFFLNDINYNSP
ncbi:MAG: hypothetical protein JXA68_03300 [Ignavibacteriales bacterium]|nr:hypothetical protein [Ignavibacteriales bacterium]